jgi:very-short-patch-repair endonuclease
VGVPYASFVDNVPGLAELLARQHRLARREQLQRLGLTRKHVAAHIGAGRWQLVAPEVVSVDNGRLDRDQLRWRAVLHATTSWLSGRSGLEVLGQQGFEPDAVQLLVPRDARPDRLAGVVIHVSDRLDGLDPSLGQRLPVVPAARAVVDAVAWSAHPRVAAGIVLDALRQGLTTAQEVDHELGLAGRIHHKVAAREALSAWRGGSESVAELDLGPLLRGAGITDFRRQVWSGGRRHDVEAVLADGTILVVEVDGAAHESAQRRWKDSERDAATLAEGKLLLRIPAYAVRHDIVAVVARLRRIADAARRRAHDR